jgi:NAD(P)-dependent dehydrogenase (short-subunit alcohol dehydrogenase family)
VAANARKLGVRAFAVKADVARDQECRRLVEETVAKLGRLDILVNNAGWSQYIPHRDLEKQARVNPMGRIPTVDDIANAALFLACDATGITAHTIFVDCGVTVLQPVV